MKPRISLVTLGVDDLERSLRFYRDGLGLPTEGIVGQEFAQGAVVFIELQGGLGLALFERAHIALHGGVQVGPRSPAEFWLGHNVGSQAEVDAVFPPGENAKDTAKQAEMVYLNAVMYVGPSAARGERVVDMVP